MGAKTTEKSDKKLREEREEENIKQKETERKEK